MARRQVLVPARLDRPTMSGSNTVCKGPCRPPLERKAVLQTSICHALDEVHLESTAEGKTDTANRHLRRMNTVMAQCCAKAAWLQCRAKEPSTCPSLLCPSRRPTAVSSRKGCCQGLLGDRCICSRHTAWNMSELMSVCLAPHPKPSTAFHPTPREHSTHRNDRIANMSAPFGAKAPP